MDSGKRKAWWRQLAGMYQGLLFLEGHLVDPGVAEGSGGDHRAPVPTGGNARRHPGAASRLAARHVREASATLTLFR